ncbi:reverse transcriptase (RNA-dependent DNA polymerase) domain-containing protein [Phthorimaea operculella]|nr:reverse transcriptase (RNA-dependent DNA polymerase) domain-containing protein [Phthorimaea operculella]
MGDTNIDYLKQSPSKRNLDDILSAYNFGQYVNFPTRIQGESSKALDLVYSNIPAERIAVKSVITNLTDHRAQRASVRFDDATERPVTFSRRITDANIASYRDALESIDWNTIIGNNNNNCETLADVITNILQSKFLICFPLKRNLPRKPGWQWIDDEIINLKSLLFDIMELSNKYPNDVNITAVATNFLTSYRLKLKDKRLNFINNLILNNDNKSKCIWNVINMETGRKRKERVDFTELILKNNDGLLLTSKQEVVNTLNDEFIGAAARCGAPRANTARSVLILATTAPPCDSSLRLAPFTPDEVIQTLLNRIAPKRSTDIYGISTHLLKNVIVSICIAVCVLFNNCMRLGKYPAALKKVKISPLYKGKGSKTALKSYRPISLVPVLSKILEAGINRRLISFLSSNQILSDRQYAYRAGRSTTDLAREVVIQILRAREAGQQVALVCCDLSRAFDTADHELIGQKLQYYGIRGKARNLILSFMQDRVQVVVGDHGHTKSSERVNEIGVPQGSCLSNSLFSLLLNDLPQALADAEVYMYADDVAAVVTARSEIELEQKLTKVVKQLMEWFKWNGLALNLDKTCFMRFNLGGKIPTQLKVKAENINLQQVTNARLLGFELDSALKWDIHIDKLCGRLGQACFALRRLAATSGEEALKACYFATVHALVTYGLELWGQAADINRIFVMQKRAVRAMAGVADDVSAVDYFRKYSILPIPCLYIYQIGVFVYENPDLYTKRGIGHSHNLRFKDRLNAVTHKLAKSNQSVYVVGPAVYNRIPSIIRNAASTAVFKNKLKTWLFERLFYKVSEFMASPVQ